MKKYSVIVNIYTAVRVEVEAENEDDAINEAELQAQADGIDLSDMEFEADAECVEEIKPVKKTSKKKVKK